MNYIKKVILPVVLAFIITLSGLSGCSIFNFFTQSSTYADRKYIEPDEQAIETSIMQVEEISKQEGKENSLIYARNAVYTEYYEVLTSYTVAMIEYYKDVTNEQAKTRYEYISAYVNSLQNAVLEMDKKLFVSSYKDYLTDLFGTDYADYLLNYSVKDEKLLELEKNETNLISKYSAISSTATSAEMASLYRNLISVRNEIAACYTDADGKPYENYLDYVYAEDYGRDYTPDDAENFRQVISQNLKTLGQKLEAEAQNKLKNVRISENTLKKLAAATIADTAPETISSWTYMTKMELYDFTASENKMNSSFVAEFYSYGDGFMFIDAYGDLLSDLDTVLHEFGHYNALFYYDDNKIGSSTINNYDLLETHSQCFELISLPSVEKVLNKYMLGDYYQSYAYNLILNSVWAMLSNSLFDRFEYVVYSSDVQTLTESRLEEIFNEACADYWPNMNYDYYDISHLFIAPGYCISYAVSMAFASEIWASANPVDNYLNVVSYGAGHYLSEVYNGVGLPNPLLPESISEVAKEYTDYAKNNFGIVA